MDDLGPLLALGLGLACHRPLQALRQKHVLDLDGYHLYSPRFLGVLVDDVPQSLVDPVPVGQQFVQFGLTQDASQRGQRDLRRRLGVVLDLDDCLLRVDYLEVDHSVHVHGHVVAGDHLLRFEDQGLDPQVHLDHAVDPGHDEVQPRLADAGQAAEAQHHPPLPLLHDLDRRPHDDQQEGDGTHHGSSYNR